MKQCKQIRIRQQFITNAPHDFVVVAFGSFILNAHQVALEGAYKDWVLLAIEDISDRRAFEQRKDDFLLVASHELKTPLTTIKGYIQVTERLLPPEASEKLKDVVKKGCCAYLGNICYDFCYAILIAESFPIPPKSIGKCIKTKDKSDMGFLPQNVL